MSYKLEGKDIVIGGFEDGIADNPYKGIADMRNVNITSIPGEASVALATQQSSSAACSGSVLSADTGTEIVTFGSVVGTLFNGRAVTFAGGSLPTGITAGTVYYLGAVSGSTAKLYTKPDLAVGNLVNITATGTGTFASVDMGKVVNLIEEPANFIQTNTPLSYNYYASDSNGRIWYYNNRVSANSLTQNIWIFLNNSLSSSVFGQGLVTWNQFLFSFSASQIAYIPTWDNATATFILLSSSWVNNWQPDGANSLNTANGSNQYGHYVITASDGIMYYCDGIYLGSLKLVSAGTTFDPTNSATYTWTRKALTLPTTETAQYLEELNGYLYIGCNSNLIYPWDKVSTSFTLSAIIRVPEANVVKMKNVNNSLYIFAGNRGNIYISNGAQAQFFKKVPDYLSGTVQPYFTWGGVASNQRTLYFGAIATTNGGSAINQYGGLWAIDLETGAIRLLNKLSYGTYAQVASALVAVNGATNAVGYSLFIGWGTGANLASTGGIDNYSGNPYTGGESIIDSDMIPIGTLLKPFTGSQVEWKVAAPLVAGESVALYYRLNNTDAFTAIPTLTASLVGALSDMIQVNFQKAQWVQLRAVLTSTSTNPTYTRLTEIRIRDYPSQ